MPQILVADDSIAVRKVAERLLTEAGLGVTLAANGEEALAVLAKACPDVVVSDVIMPDKSGYEICTYVRGNSTLASTPVLLISGIVNDEVTKQAEACRADGILKKPFQGTSLKDRVIELLAKRQPDVSPVPPSPPAPTPKLTPPIAAAAAQPAEQGMRLAGESPSMDRQSATKLMEVEQLLSAERARTSQLMTQITELEAEIGRGKEVATALETERRRADELQVRVDSLGRQTTTIPQLEAALKEERDRVSQLRQESEALQQKADRVQELEAMLETERAAAAQLVQQLNDQERIAAQAIDLEAQLEGATQRVSDLQGKAHAAEAAAEDAQGNVARLTERITALEKTVQRKEELEILLAVERKKQKENEQQREQLEASASKAQELEVLLATEREHNGLLARRVSEAEVATKNATKRFEDMAKKLSEIAVLASQLGNAKVQP